MYELYIGNKNYSSWSLRPWLLMSALGISFRERLVPFADGMSPDAFRRFSPTGRVPCLIDAGLTIWDSLAITEYLAERHAGVWPEEAATRAWARCAVAEMHSGFGSLRGLCPMNCGIRVRIDGTNPGLQRDMKRLDELWSDGLGRFGGPFLAGARFTAVDAFFAPVAFRIQTYAISMPPTSLAYVKLLLDLEPMQEWYAAGLAESWREPVHEAESKAAGVWLADLRKNCSEKMGR